MSGIRNNWEESTLGGSSRFTGTTTGLDVEEAAQDTAYVLKLHRKVKQSFMQRGVNGISALQAIIRQIDVDRDRRVDIWEFKNIFRGQGLKLSDKELEVLFYCYDPDGSGELDFDEFLGEIREHLCCTQQQMDDILKRIRSKLAEMDGYAAKGAPPALMGKLFPGVNLQTDAISKLMWSRCFKKNRAALGISPSDVVFVFRYFQNEDGTVSGRDILRYLHGRPSQKQVIDSIVLKFRDAVEDRDRTHSGCIGLTRMLLRNGGQVQDPERLKQGLKNFGCGLRDGEIDLLLDVLEDDEAANCRGDTRTDSMLHVETLVNLLQQDPLIPPETELAALLKKLRKELSTRHRRGLVRLALDCREIAGFPVFSGDARISKFDLASAVRGMLTAAQFPDLEIELVFNFYCDRESKMRREWCDNLSVKTLLEAIQGEFPLARLAIVEETWRKIDVEDDNQVSLDTVVAAFKPAAVPDVQSGKRSAADVLHELRSFLAPLQGSAHTEGAVVAKDAFFFYWLCVSASIETDKEFTLQLWSGFEINRMRKTNAQADRYHSQVTASPTQASPAAQIKRRSVEASVQRRINPVTHARNAARAGYSAADANAHSLNTSLKDDAERLDSSIRLVREPSETRSEYANHHPQHRPPRSDASPDPARTLHENHQYHQGHTHGPGGQAPPGLQPKPAHDGPSSPNPAHAEHSTPVRSPAPASAAARAPFESSQPGNLSREQSFENQQRPLPERTVPQQRREPSPSRQSLPPQPGSVDSPFSSSAPPDV
eukprot:gene7985-12264_t